MNITHQLFKIFCLALPSTDLEAIPILQYAIGIVRYERYKEELSRCVQMLNRAIDLNTDPDRLVNLLIDRSEIYLSFGTLSKALQDLEATRPLVADREAKGREVIHQELSSIDKRIAFVKAKLEDANHHSDTPK